MIYSYRTLVALPRNPLILGPLLAAYEATKPGDRGRPSAYMPKRVTRYVPAEERGHEWPGRPYGPAAAF